jgi:hypothetical protein
MLSVKPAEIALQTAPGEPNGPRATSGHAPPLSQYHVWARALLGANDKNRARNARRKADRATRWATGRKPSLSHVLEACDVQFWERNMDCENRLMTPPLTHRAARKRRSNHAQTRIQSIRMCVWLLKAMPGYLLSRPKAERIGLDDGDARGNPDVFQRRLVCITIGDMHDERALHI